MKHITTNYKSGKITKAEAIRQIFSKVAEKIIDYSAALSQTKKELTNSQIKVYYSELQSATKDMWVDA